MIKEKCMISRSTTVLVGVASLFAGPAIPVANAQQVSGPVRVVQLTGLVGVKDNAKGTLSVDSGNLHFVHGKTSWDVNAASIQDVGTADVVKKVLVAQGAHTTATGDSTPAATSSTSSKEQKQ